MEFLDKIKAAFTDDDEEAGAHDAPDHDLAEGLEKDWSASDLSPDELVDDNWIARNIKGVE